MAQLAEFLSGDGSTCVPVSSVWFLVLFYPSIASQSSAGDADPALLPGSLLGPRPPLSSPRRQHLKGLPLTLTAREGQEDQQASEWEGRLTCWLTAGPVSFLFSLPLGS